jgi:hypothetical protein
MPYRLAVTRAGEQGLRLGQQTRQAPQVPRPIRALFRLQLRRITESGDQVRIGVLVRPPWPV